MSHLRGLRRRLRKKQSEFIAHHDFISDGDLLLSQEELADAVELNKIISVMLHGKLQFPAFQFNTEGEVYPILQEHLPRLLGSDRSGWDICFWLFTRQAVTLKRVAPNAAALKGVSIEEMLELGKLAASLTERFEGRPIDAVTDEKSDVFAVCVEHLLNPDYRVIPELDDFSRD